MSELQCLRKKKKKKSCRTRSQLLLSQLLVKVNKVVSEVRKEEEKHPPSAPDGLEAKEEQAKRR